MATSAHSPTQRRPFETVFGILPAVAAFACAVLLVFLEIFGWKTALNVASAVVPLLAGLVGAVLLRRAGSRALATVGLAAVVAIETFVIAAPTYFILRFFAFPLYWSEGP